MSAHQNIGTIKHKKFFLIASLITFCIAAFCLYSFLRPAGKINEYPIPLDELQLYADTARSDTISHFYVEYGADSNDSKFWDTEYNGITPKDYLLDTARKLILRDHVLWELAAAHGINASLSYVQKEKDWKAENNKRSHKQQTEQVIYGTEELSMEQYLSYKRTELTDKLKTLLLQTDLKPTEADLRQAYKELPEEVLDKGYFASIVEFSCSDSEIAPRVFEEIHNQIVQEIPISKLTNSLRDIYGNVLSVEIYEITPEIHREDTSLQLIYDICRNLKAETFSNDVEDQNPNIMYYVLEKNDYGQMTYEGSGDYAKIKWINEQFDAYLTEMTQKADVEWNLSVIRKIKIT